MSKLYNIIDSQLGDYYEEGITLKEAKETALRFVERAMLEGDTDHAKAYAKMLAEVERATTFEDMVESLGMFDYTLEEA